MKTPPPTIRCMSCGYFGCLFVSHHGYKWWVLPLAFLLACTGIGLIPLAIIFMWLGNQTSDLCPNCGGRDLRLWPGQPSAESQAIWAKAQEADDKAFKKNKLILLGIVMTMLAAALAFMFYMLGGR